MPARTVEFPVGQNEEIHIRFFVGFAADDRSEKDEFFDKGELIEESLFEFLKSFLLIAGKKPF